MLRLSILIPTLDGRAGMLDRLLSILNRQLTDEVEIITDCDDGRVSIGTKRNRLLSQAKGEYVCFVDDDDTVSDDYIACLIQGITKNVDVVCIKGIFTTNGQDPSPFYDAVKQGHGLRRINGQVEYTRGVQHLDAIRRTIATAAKFPDSSFGEDYEYGIALERSGLIQSSWEVDHPIYFYDYRWPKDRCDEPKFAVVMPVYNHVYTTTKTVESLLSSTHDQNFVLIMVDDDSTDDTCDYARDLTQRLGSRRFHYHKNRENLGVNASWNVGIGIARARGARKIAVVNNDVLFAPDWDTPILAALEIREIGVVSPLSTYGPTPLDWPKGGSKNVNPAGYLGYMPILGACFAARTSVFTEVGPFPEELKIYFGDNWLCAAVQAAGYECGYEDESYVHHMFCITTSKLNNDKIWPIEGPIFDKIMSDNGWVIKPLSEPIDGNYGTHLGEPSPVGAQ